MRGGDKNQAAKLILDILLRQQLQHLNSWSSNNRLGHGACGVVSTDCLKNLVRGNFYLFVEYWRWRRGKPVSHNLLWWYKTMCILWNWRFKLLVQLVKSELRLCAYQPETCPSWWLWLPTVKGFTWSKHTRHIICHILRVLRTILSAKEPQQTQRSNNATTQPHSKE